MSTVITPFQGTDSFSTATFNNRISQINTGFSYISNPNLLDNWYFGNPVNQRGQTSYTGAGYGIDRWINTGDGTVIIESDGIRMHGNCTLDNRIPFGVLRPGTVATMSIFVDDEVYSYTQPIIDEGWGQFQFSASGFTGRFLSQSNSYGVASVFNNGNSNLLKAAKLELGTQQTLAHQENGVWVLNEIPDYGEQLARCHGYLLDSRESGSENSYSGIAVETWLLVTNVVFPEVMREIPGVKLYNHSAVDHVRRIADNADLSLPSSMVITRTKNGITFIYEPSHANTFIKGAAYDFNVVANAEL